MGLLRAAALDDTQVRTWSLDPSGTLHSANTIDHGVYRSLMILRRRWRWLSVLHLEQPLPSPAKLDLVVGEMIIVFHDANSAAPRSISNALP